MLPRSHASVAPFIFYKPMNDIINDLARFLREHGWTLCYAWSASLLIIYGRVLANTAKNIAKTWHFFFRILFFLAVCGFGYGLLTVYLTKYLHRQLSQLPNLWYILAVFCAFLILGILADRKKQL
ncbi:MAG: H+/Cl- antiporter ClcA [Crocinitomicaceae bacterium]|jgi:H+/Cl- antiporter ClcA